MALESQHAGPGPENCNTVDMQQTQLGYAVEDVCRCDTSTWQIIIIIKLTNNQLTKFINLFTHRQILLFFSMSYRQKKKGCFE